MQTFHAQRTESVEGMSTFKAHLAKSPDHPSGPHTPAMRAPGRIVMVIREGSIWVRREDGSQETIPAPSVVTWEPGDWVEYGIWPDEEYKIDSWWSKSLSDHEWAARMTQAFGPDFMNEATGSGGAG